MGPAGRAARGVCLLLLLGASAKRHAHRNRTRARRRTSPPRAADAAPAPPHPLDGRPLDWRAWEPRALIGAWEAQRASLPAVPFYMYDGVGGINAAQLIASYKGCPHYRSWAGARHTGDVHFLEQLLNHPWRVRRPEEALLLVPPVAIGVDHWCPEPFAARTRRTLAAVQATPSWRARPQDHLFVALHYDVRPEDIPGMPDALWAHHEAVRFEWHLDGRGGAVGRGDTIGLGHGAPAGGAPAARQRGKSGKSGKSGSRESGRGLNTPNSSMLQGVPPAGLKAALPRKDIHGVPPALWQQFGSHVSVNSSAGAVHVAPLMAPQTDRGSGLWAYGEGAAPGLGGDGGAGSHATAGARAAGGAGAHAHATLPPGGGSGGAADGGAAGGGRVRNITFFFGGKSSVHHPIVRPGYHMRASMFIQAKALLSGQRVPPSNVLLAASGTYRLPACGRVDLGSEVSVACQGRFKASLAGSLFARSEFILSIRGDTPGCDRLYVGFEFGAIPVLVAQAAMAVAVPFQCFVPFELMLARANSTLFRADAPAALAEVLAAWPVERRAHARALMRHFAADVLWHAPGSRVATNLLLDAARVPEVPGRPARATRAIRARIPCAFQDGSIRDPMSTEQLDFILDLSHRRRRRRRARTA